MFQPWRTEDFLPAADEALQPADFWEPKIKPSQSATAATPAPTPPNDFWESSQTSEWRTGISLLGGLHGFDFWDPIPFSSDLAVPPVSGWSEDVALPLYEAHASESPFRLEEVSRFHEGISHRRARWLASLLDLPTVRARRWFADKFEELFDEYPHHNTFRVLSEFAIDCASADEILVSFELKQVWADHPIFWSIRRKGFRGPFVPNGGERQLGWTRAIRLVNLAKGLPAERIIDSDWYEEWLRLPHGDPLFWSFLEYATARLNHFPKVFLGCRRY